MNIPNPTTRIQTYRKNRYGVVKLVDVKPKPKLTEEFDDTDEVNRMIEIWQEKRRRTQTSFYTHLCNPKGIKKQNYQLSEIIERLENGIRT